MDRIRVPLVFATWVCAAALAGAPAAAAPITFVEIASPTQAGSPWSSNANFEPPAVEGSRVAFTVFDPVGQSGVFSSSGGTLTTIAEPTTPIPGGGGVLGFLERSPSLSGGSVAFVSRDALGQAAIYTGSGAALTTVANSSTPDPAGPGNLQPERFSPSVQGSDVLFRATDSGGFSGIYLSSGGAVTRIADETTSVPGGSGLLSVSGAPVLDGSDAAFAAGHGSGSGVYVSSGGVVRTVADESTALPGGGGNFVSFANDVAFAGGSLAFEGIDIVGSGIYAEIGGSLEVVADSSTLIPGRVDPFVGFTSPGRGLAIDGDDVAFMGTGALTPDGIYVRYQGQLVKVIDTDDSLDGRDIGALGFGNEGLSGARLAFTVLFSDGSEAVYLAIVPQPGTAGLLAGGLALLGARRPTRVGRRAAS